MNAADITIGQTITTPSGITGRVTGIDISGDQYGFDAYTFFSGGFISYGPVSGTTPVTVVN